jgi:UDP-N-acetylmuramate: L-alanyl-gamma-D-glutamyl-meso-diaminopimelate ligase
VNAADQALARVLQRGSWTPVDRFNAADRWHAGGIEEGSAHEFDVLAGSTAHGRLQLALAGEHNRSNAIAAIAAADGAGIAPERSIGALRAVSGVRRRLEVAGEAFGVTVYDDFAHHPTAIEATLQGLRRRIGQASRGSAGAASRLVAVFEPRSNTMRLGSMRQALVDSLKLADRVFCYAPREGRRAVAWDASEALRELDGAVVADDLDQLAARVAEAAQSGDHVVVMSNGGFGGMPQRILDGLSRRARPLAASSGG